MFQYFNVYWNIKTKPVVCQGASCSFAASHLSAEETVDQIIHHFWPEYGGIVRTGSVVENSPLFSTTDPVRI